MLIEMAKSQVLSFRVFKKRGDVDDLSKVTLIIIPSRDYLDFLIISR
jgi:hypothetical protein